MKPLNSFTPQERRGVFYLLLIIILFQIIHWSLSFIDFGTGPPLFTEDKELQKKLEVVLRKEKTSLLDKTYLFNPNFISDYKGYTYGMTNDEIDRLHRFREEGKWVYSAEDFQKVTGVSDSLLSTISSNFKFPEWRQETREETTSLQKPNTLMQITVKDINTVSEEDLQVVYGVGPRLSARVIKFRDRLGGFRDDRQIYHVYGLEQNRVAAILRRFRVLESRDTTMLNINTATNEEIKDFVYFSRPASKAILEFRDSVGIIKSWKELEQIENFPADKIEIIKLYLSL
ncbi:ComEA family DNA-binding protein [Eudoraea chungangensis]|uniref:ComEA family DNA-binding protein n=1 Tax=Eudoraea chungangensis TaxID=1481905 RepID=UPI0023EDE753|nr:helix-hairpin-helix domain-containing protein [Eudoraea chungangensis]